MRSDRNEAEKQEPVDQSLVDWEMRSDRNVVRHIGRERHSLVDWEMRSDRNRLFELAYPYPESSRLGNALRPER